MPNLKLLAQKSFTDTLTSKIEKHKIVGKPLFIMKKNASGSFQKYIISVRSFVNLYVS